MVLEVLNPFLKIISYFFIGYILFYSIYLFISALIGMKKMFHNIYKKIMHNNVEHDYYIPISILIPAYNVEDTIISNIDMLVTLDYKLFEIVIINDESTDDTLKKILANLPLEKVKRPYCKKLKTKKIKAIYEGKYQNISITLIDKEKGGKADSLNAGINMANYPYFLTMNATSSLQKDSLEKIIRPVLEEENVIVCEGFNCLTEKPVLNNNEIVKYPLPRKLLACMQMLEYNRTFLLSKIIFDEYNTNLINTNEFALFKKSFVLENDGYDTNTSGENFELVAKMQAFCIKNKKKYHIRYVPDAICYTQASTNLSNLIKDKKKWYAGFLRCILKYKTILCNSHRGFLSSISHFCYLLFEFCAPFIEIIGIIATIAALCSGALDGVFIALFYLIYILFGSVISLTAFFACLRFLEKKISFLDICKMIFVSIFEFTILRFIIIIFRFITYFNYKKNTIK